MELKIKHLSLEEHISFAIKLKGVRSYLRELGKYVESYNHDDREMKNYLKMVGDIEKQIDMMTANFKKQFDKSNMTNPYHGSSLIKLVEVFRCSDCPKK